MHTQNFLRKCSHICKLYRNVSIVESFSGAALSEGSDYPDYEDLTYLSSRQAVRDVVQFVQSDETAQHLGGLNNVKWVTFGGSYPGMLSAWSRLLYPR